MQKTLLLGPDLFDAYQAQIDSELEDHKHIGTPISYPCVVESTVYADEKIVAHRFIFPEKVQCAKCAHINDFWRS